MKINKLLTPIIALGITTPTVIPMVACNDKDMVKVSVTTNDGIPVRMQHKKATKNKAFVSKIYLDDVWMVDTIKVKVGDKELQAGVNFTFFDRTLKINEGLIDGNVSIELTLSAILTGVTRYEIQYGHLNLLLSDPIIVPANTDYTFDVIMLIKYKGWQQTGETEYPTHFYMSWNDPTVAAKITSDKPIILFTQNCGDIGDIEAEVDPDKDWLINIVVKPEGHLEDNSVVCLGFQCKFPTKPWSETYHFAGQVNEPENSK